jgi:hypothetical protein
MRVPPALFLFIAVPIGAQTHCDVHYRWQEKTDTTHSRYGGEHVSLEDVELVIASFHRG